MPATRRPNPNDVHDKTETADTSGATDAASSNPNSPHVSHRRDRRIDLALLVVAVLGFGLLGARGLGLIGADDGDDPVQAPAYDDEGEDEAGDDREANAPPMPTPGPAPLTWAPGIQTWLHWYDIYACDPQLSALDAQGFTWVKQRFAWADMQPVGEWSDEALRHHSARYGSEDPPGFGPIDWTHSDAFLDAIDRRAPGTHVLIQLDVPPSWAREEDIDELDLGELPFDVEAWWEFVFYFADRYAGRVHAYEIGNEPNLRHADSWPTTPDPAAYAWMLEQAKSAVEEADPHALVISAGLSPTGDDGMPEAMADDLFLEGLYDAMEAEWGGYEGPASDFYFDALGAHAPGFRAAPEVSPDEAAADPELGGQRFFTFRRVEDLRAIMDGRGDGEKPIVITELSWTTDPRPESPYHWSAIDGATRANYLARALDFAAENWGDWIGPIFLFSAPDRAWTGEHEAYWRAVTDQEGWLKDGLRVSDIASPARRAAMRLAEQEEAWGAGYPEPRGTEDNDTEPGDGGGEPEVRLGLDPAAQGTELPLRILDPVDLPIRNGSARNATRWTGGAPAALALGGSVVALARGERFRLADRRDPAAVRWVYESEPLAGEIDGLHVDEGMDTGLVLSGSFGLQWYNVTDPANPRLVATSEHKGRLAGHTPDGWLVVETAGCPARAPEPSSSLCSRLFLLDIWDDEAHPVIEVTGGRSRWAVLGGDLVTAPTGEREGFIEVHDLVAVHRNRTEGTDTHEAADRDREPDDLRVGTKVLAIVPYDHGIVAVVEDPTISEELPYGRQRLVIKTIELLNGGSPRVVGTATIDSDAGATWVGDKYASHVAVVETFCHVGVCDAMTRVVDLRDPSAPEISRGMGHATGHRPSVVAVADGWLATDEGTGLALVAIDRPMGDEPLVESSRLPMPLSITGGDRDQRTHVAALTDGTQVLARGTQLQLLAPFDPEGDGTAASARILATIDELACDPGTRTAVSDVAVAGDLVLVAGWEAGLIVIDAGEPTEPMHLGCFLGGASDVRAVAVDRASGAKDRASTEADSLNIYVAGQDYDTQRTVVHHVDLSQPTSPEILATAPLADSQEGIVADLALDGGIVYVALHRGASDRGQSLYVLDWRDPRQPLGIAPPPVRLAAEAIAAADGIVAMQLVDCPEGEGSWSPACKREVRIFAPEAAPDGSRPERLDSLAAQARYGTVEADLLMLPATEGGDPTELWLASKIGIWAFDLSDPHEPRMTLVTWEGASTLAALPEGGLLLAGEQGVTSDIRMANWE